ncbi:MAG TPA: hypothetical protein DEB39_01180, partial [Planctomycetaceae bacterium]|nr:hypothetical protein [Planctomycetaceae bacterium]
MNKASRKKMFRKRNCGQILAGTVSPIILAAIASLFPAADVPANVTTTQVPGGQIVTVDSSAPNPWTSTIGTGINTPAAGTTYDLHVLPGAAISVVNRNAISLGNNLSITIDGTVTGNSSSGGIYGTGPNVIEANSGVTILVNQSGSVQQIGSTTNGEAINLHGFGNTIRNYGMIGNLHGAAIWFQDTASGGGDPTKRNEVTNYGVIETHVDGGSVIGTSAGNGIVFYNKNTGVVNGNLTFAQGNDDLYFEAGSFVNGDINGGGGANNVLLEGDGSLGVGTLNGYIQNFQTLTKIDTGTWLISGQLQGFRTTTVDDGVLRILGDNSRYTGTLLINPNGIVEARAQSLPSNGSAGPNNSNLTNNGTLRFVQGVSYDSAPDDPTDSGTYYGQIIGTGYVEVDGPGTVILAPTNANGNTYSGGTVVKRGTLAVGTDNALGAVDGGLILGSADSAGGNVGTLRLLNSFVLDPNRTVRLAGAGGAIDTQGYTTTLRQAFQAGSSDLYKQGTGTLILTGDGGITGAAHIQQGTLQLGDGGTTGSLAANYDISAGAALAYAHSNDVEEMRDITGDGKVVQRGTGSLALQNILAFYFGTAYTGGTEIESGTLYINDPESYNQADHRATVHPERAGTKAGYITFTGAAGNVTKNVILADTDPGMVELVNSFRTQTGAGDDNNLFLIPPAGPLTLIDGVNIEDDGAAFYVADGTTMNVLTNELYLTNNIANGRPNDLYVENGGTFTLGTGSWTVFDSGIDGDGTLNLVSISSAAMVQLFGSVNPKTYHTGTTNVYGRDLNVSGLGAMYLNLARNDDTTEIRVVFDHTNSFNIDGGGVSQAAILAGDGIIQAGNEINVVNGAVLTPFDLATFGSPAALPETLTLRAPTVNLSDFVLAGQVNYTSGAVQNPLRFDSQDIPLSNNDLLSIEADTVHLGSGLIYLQTANGTTFTPGDYLVVRSTNGFSGVTTNIQLNALLSVNVDGFDLNPTSNSPRGGYELQLGGDPDPVTGEYTGTTKNNIWFTHNLNSLTMAWTGGGSEAVPDDGSWDSGEIFYSLQDHDGNGIHERRFTTGDKVHISGTNSFEINLLSDSVLMPGKIVTSGLVVG